MTGKAFKILVTGMAMICLVIVGSVLSGGLDPARFWSGLGEVALASNNPASTGMESRLYLPVVIQNYPNRSVFGIEMASVTDTSGADLMEQAGAYWIRRNGLLWSDVESVEGSRDWSKVDALANDMKNATSRGMNVLLVVRGAPDWAADRPCGPVYRDRFSEFGSFLADAVDHFSRPPYNVLYYEIWNEPDIDPINVAPDKIFGCWGDQNNPYYGGEYYGDMLNVVYPMMKAANPDVKVLVGGLLLDCDPALGSGCIGDPKSSLFLEGILRSTRGSSFDGVGFHAYDYLGDPGSVGQFANLNWGALWNNDFGPVLNAKAAYIRNLLNTYQVTGKFLLNTESALVDVPDNCSICEDTKAYYLAQSYASAIHQDLLANVWYSFSGWRGSGLVLNTQTTLPAYTAYDVANNQLAGSTSLQTPALDPGVKALAFGRDNRTIWLVWSKDGANHPVTLPKVPNQILNVYGASTTPTGTSFTVTIQPTYLIFTP